MKKLFISLITTSLLMGSYPAHAFDIKWEKKHTYIIAAVVALIGMGLYASIKGHQAQTRALEQAALNAKLYREEQERRQRHIAELIASRPNTTVIIANELPTPANFELTLTKHPRLNLMGERDYPAYMYKDTVDSESTKVFKIPRALGALHENLVKPTLTVSAHGLPDEKFDVNIVDKPEVAITIKPKQLIGIEQAA